MEETRQPNDSLVVCAICGLLCSACAVYLASADDPEWLARLARHNHVSLEEERCLGCRSSDISYHCEMCHFAECAKERGLLFCIECPDFPCSELAAWRSRMPHRIETVAALQRIRDVGWDAWHQEAIRDFTCPTCGTINSAYNVACRMCGAEPSCTFVERHRGTIDGFVTNQ